MGRIDSSGLDIKEKVISINRVCKVVKGGKRFNFSALVAVGDENGHVGIGLGKASEVPSAIKKAIEQARKNLIHIELKDTTIPYQVSTKFGAAKVFLKPASRGTGLIAGGAARPILELAGVKDILTKSHGSNNPLNVAAATISALKEMSFQMEMRKQRTSEEKTVSAESGDRSKVKSG